MAHPRSPISTPAGFAPAVALGYSDADNRLEKVSEAKPLPVTIQAGEGSPALEGMASADTLVGPFAAAAGRAIVVTLAGEFVGTARLLRSTDGGATKVGLLVADHEWGVITSPGCEQVWVESEAGATFYLEISIDSGAMTYRVSQ